MASDEGRAGAGEGLPPGLAALLSQTGSPAAPRPVEFWHPERCGPLPLRINADGAWIYHGSPIAREALVRLFASVLRREPDGSYVLVTPVEKLVIEVEDAPFLAVEMAADGEGRDARLSVRTNVGDVATIDAAHPLRFAVEPRTGGLKPYVRVRGGLDALLARGLVPPLIERAETHGGRLGLWSAGAFFPLPEG